MTVPSRSPTDGPVSATPEEALTVWRNAEMVCSPEQVDTALRQMASEIATALSHRNPLILTVLNGALMVAAQLAVRLEFPLQMGYLHATRYKGNTRGGELHWVAPPSISVLGRTVLVVDDILDEGTTLKAILEDIRRSGAAEVYSAVLVNKRHDRKEPGLRVDFVGLEVEDRYVFGCGMDYKEYLRNLPAIYAVAEANA